MINPEVLYSYTEIQNFRLNEVNLFKYQFYLNAENSKLKISGLKNELYSAKDAIF